jgi:putative flippase GtrA
MRRRLPPSLQRFTRYLTSGGFVAFVNLGTGALLLTLGVEVQLTVAIAFVVTITTHFTLQRVFVFAGEGAFALTLGQQLRRYLAMAAVQYPTTAGLVALLVGVGLQDFDAVVCTALLVAPVTFVLLRTRMFHRAAGDESRRGARHKRGSTPV